MNEQPEPVDRRVEEALARAQGIMAEFFQEARVRAIVSAHGAKAMIGLDVIANSTNSEERKKEFNNWYKRWEKKK